MWVIYCTLTKKYLTDTASNIDDTDINNAKVFKTLKGTKSACSQARTQWDGWHKLYNFNDPLDFSKKRNWVILESAITITPLQQLSF